MSEPIRRLSATQARRYQSPTAHPWTLFTWGLAAWALILLPLALLQQVDALLVYVTPGRFWKDVALILSLAVIPAASFAFAGTAAAVCARWLGVVAAADKLAWAITLLPTCCLCAWQLARTAVAWVRPASEFKLSIGPNERAIAAVLLAVAAVIIWRRLGVSRIRRALVEPVLALRSLSLLVVGSACAVNIAIPPTMHSGEPAAKPASLPSSVTGAQRPDVFLISIDALAFEDAGGCTEMAARMPHLQRLALHSTCFSRLYASSNFTTPTTSTLETGTLPWTHWAAQIGAQIAPPLQDRTLAQSLQRMGYRTHSVSANYLASPRHHGTYRGYDSDEISPSTSLGGKLTVPLARLADSTLALWAGSLLPFVAPLDVFLHDDKSPVDPRLTYDRVPSLLQGDRAVGLPSFVWAHTLPPHAPYLPPRTAKHKLLPAGELDHWRQLMTENTRYSAGDQALVDKHRLRYRECIMGADEALGEFLDALQRSGRLDNALIIVTADHGESFERGLIGHAGPMLHDALLHIPLIVKLPRQRETRIVDMPVSQADIVPTLLDAVGASALPDVDGRSLMPLLRGQGLEPAPVFSMSMELQSRFKPLSQGHFAVVDGRYKLIAHLREQRQELYDLAADPHELHDISHNEPTTAARLQTLLIKRITAAESVRRSRFGP